VEKLFEARGRENYREACGHLLRIRELYRNLGWEKGRIFLGDTNFFKQTAIGG